MENNNNCLFENAFDEQNFIYDNLANGTTKETFDRRKHIDRKNLEETFDRSGIRWDMYGECKICGKECRRRCDKCPWIFYCSREHQLEHWPEHKKNCKCIEWDENGTPRAGRDLAEGTIILEKSTIFVAPRYHTDAEKSQLTDIDYYEQSDGCLRPCFGCHMQIPPYFNLTQVCNTCKFPIHNAACEVSPWHVNECQILKLMQIQHWYDEIGTRKNVMEHMAVLRGTLLKKCDSTAWKQIMSLGTESLYLISEELKRSVVHFIVNVCRVEGIVEEEVVKFLTIFMKQRLNCGLPWNMNKRLVNVLCSGAIPFTLVNGKNANVQGAVENYRMRVVFRTIKSVKKGELLTIGRGCY